MVVELGGFLKRMGFIIISALVFGLMQGRFSETDTYEIMLSGLGVLGLIGAFFKYQFTRFGIQDQSFVYRSGWLHKQERTIPVERIQNVDVVRSLIHRALGLADIRIDTGAVGDAEVTLSALTLEEAETLKRELLHRRVGDFSVADEVVQERPLYQATSRDLLLAGITGNGAGLIFAFVFTFLVNPLQRQAMDDWVSGMIRNRDVRNFLDHGFQWNMLPPIIGIMAAFILAGWILNMIRSYVTYYGFTLSRSPDRLVVHYGLTTHTQSSVLLRRIQAVVFKQGWAMNALGLWEVHAYTAGGKVVQKSENGEVQTASTSSVVSPALPDDRIPEFGTLLLPGVDLRYIRFKSLSPKVRVRWILGGTLVWTFLFGVAAWFLGKQLLVLLPIPIGLTVLGAIKRFAYAGFARMGPFLIVRDGWLTREMKVVPVGKVQIVNYSQSWRDRLYKMANVSLTTATFGFASNVAIENLTESDAVSLFFDLEAATSQSGAWQLDGV